MTTQRPITERPATEAREPITAETRMQDAARRNPDVPVVLMRFHIGGCSMCGYEDTDTVAQVAADNGVPVAELLAALNAPR